MADLQSDLEKRLPKELVEQLLETYEEVKRNYYLGNLRPNEVEGGRFAEAVFRILEFAVANKYTPLGKRITDFERRCEDFRNISDTVQPDSIRLHIPRTIRLVYDIRNKRDAAHLADGIDPNLQDASFVIACCDWTLAEVVRLYHKVSADEAHRIIDELVTRKAPVVEEFGGFLKTLNPRLGPSDRIIVLLYHRGKNGAAYDELNSWLRPTQRVNLKRTLENLEHERDLIIPTNGRYFITRLGMREVERRGLFKPIS